MSREESGLWIAYFGECCVLLSVALQTRPTDVLRVVSSFLTAIRKLIEFLPKVVFHSIQPAKSLVRLAEQIGRHRTLMSPYAYIAVCDLLRVLAASAIPHVVRKELHRAAYYLLDATGRREMPVLNSRLSPEERDVFRSIYAAYVAKHKFSGKA
eukprot:TRINITY_DN16690_c0_g1_i1.p2 TRINITY_DN16690_c0_g1~~TRINITY_DN16690_c0_g1_i1.p2  ORF type:complete len:180 (-),score=66.99 TRINITY_DN16690_c0_g1_i1:159-620(-)